MFDTLKADFGRYFEYLPDHRSGWTRVFFFLSCQGLWAIVDYRWRRWLLAQPKITRLILWIPTFFAHVFTETQTGISLPTGCQIGKGLYIGHFCGIFVHDTVVMGENCNLSQGVSIGLGGKANSLVAPRLGNQVYVGAGAKVLGPITLGDRVRVGANAVVLDSVPEGATAVGIPARVIQKKQPGEP